MTSTLEPVAVFAHPLDHSIIKATLDSANEWFFFDGARTAGQMCRSRA
jgi:hypothetical protein